MPPARLLFRRALRILGLLLATCLLGSITLVGLLRVIDPPVSAFILRHALLARLDPALPPPQFGAFVPLSAMSPELPLAVVAAEDQRFAHHHGFDLTELRRAWSHHRGGGRLRGASTSASRPPRICSCGRGGTGHARAWRPGSPC